MTIQSASHPFVYQDMLINPFMADPDGLIFTQPSRNRFWAPIQAQLGIDHVPCFLKDANSSVPVAIEGLEMGLPGPITFLATITMQFPADGGFIAANHSGYLRLVMTYFRIALTPFCTSGVSAPNRPQPEPS